MKLQLIVVCMASLAMQSVNAIQPIHHSFREKADHKLMIAQSTIGGAMVREHLQMRSMQAHPHAVRPKRIDPRVAEFNRDAVDYKRTVAALRRDVQHLIALQSRLVTLSNEVNSSSQMDMIHLQSIMSNRQTAVQISTNLIQALGKSADAIAKNTGK